MTFKKTLKVIHNFCIPTTQAIDFAACIKKDIISHALRVRPAKHSLELWGACTLRHSTLWPKKARFRSGRGSTACSHGTSFFFLRTGGRVRHHKSHSSRRTLKSSRSRAVNLNRFCFFDIKTLNLKISFAFYLFPAGLHFFWFLQSQTTNCAVI